MIYFDRNFTISTLFAILLFVRISTSFPARSKRWSDPQEQLHRRRRNELLYSRYNKLIQDLLQNNPQIRIAPIQFRSDQSEANIIYEIITSVNSLANQLHRSISLRHHHRFYFGNSRSVSSALAKRAKLWKQGVKVHIKHLNSSASRNLNVIYITKAEERKLQTKLRNFCKTLAKKLQQISPGIRIAECS